VFDKIKEGVAECPYDHEKNIGLVRTMSPITCKKEY